MKFPWSRTPKKELKPFPFKGLQIAALDAAGDPVVIWDNPIPTRCCYVDGELKGLFSLTMDYKGPTTEVAAAALIMGGEKWQVSECGPSKIFGGDQVTINWEVSFL